MLEHFVFLTHSTKSNQNEQISDHISENKIE